MIAARCPILLATALFVFGVHSTSWAGKYNPTLSIGDTAPAWKELPGTDGKQHSFSEWKEKEVLVVLFTCNSCPYAVEYEKRVKDIVADYAEKSVELVAINVNKVEEDLLPAMKKRATEQKFNFSYLFDESQQIARDYGAGYTPEFFVLDKERKIVYMGSLDDSPDASKVKKHYVADAIDAVLAGKTPEVKETVPIGCRVRLERVRRRRRAK